MRLRGNALPEHRAILHDVLAGLKLNRIIGVGSVRALLARCRIPVMGRLSKTHSRIRECELVESPRTGRRIVVTGGATARRSPPTRHPWNMVRLTMLPQRGRGGAAIARASFAPPGATDALPQIPRVTLRPASPDSAS